MNSLSQSGDAEIAQASACSRPPEPISRIFMGTTSLSHAGTPCIDQGAARWKRVFSPHIHFLAACGLAAAQAASGSARVGNTLNTRPMARSAEPKPVAPAGNAPELSVSDLAGALKRTIEDAFGHVRVRGEVSGYRGPHFLRPCLFHPQGPERPD